MRLLTLLSFFVLSCGVTKPSHVDSTRALISRLSESSFENIKFAFIIPPNSCIACRKEFLSFFHANPDLVQSSIFIGHEKSVFHPIKSNILEDKDLRMFDLPFKICNISMVYLNNSELGPYCYSTPETEELTKDLKSLGISVNYGSPN